MLSFRNTLLRWYSTVDVVTNRRVAITALVTPAAASRAICVSCGLRARAASSAAARKRGRPHGVEHAVGRAQLCAGVPAAFLAAQPLAVQQMGSGEFRADRGPLQVRDGLGIERLGSGVGGQQRA